ncbi:MAG: DUF3141 domain-containing protein [Proteobacteria bacterium]|nr:DUF3141 domain-containing protein [Pseudomonadota bacterium]
MAPTETNSFTSFGTTHYLNACTYLLDSFQKSILFADALRKRGNTYLKHIENGQPPALIYNYKVILDGKKLERPVNYSLAKIQDRRRSAPPKENVPVERRDSQPLKETIPDLNLRPIIIVDPRAGHGPGIGGSKEDSEIGMAMNQGHTVYFLIFSTEPEPGQTLGDVKNAMTRFFEEVQKRHPKAPRPAVIGNCQGGWASAIVGADRPDLVGPLLLNGSPMSYWSGVEGQDPLRYKGGLLGGVWMNSFLSDLNNGYFDGANLVLNFELLNPANSYWNKLHNLYDKIDTEEQRFLNFEKWWGGFFILTKSEIHQIVNDLFVGNKLVQGKLEFEEGNPIDLKKFNDPVVVFASKGDNITPPQQALNWIPIVYKSVDEIKRHQQVIVYIVHPEIGHLGIFVSSSIAKKEQREIIGSVEMIDYLAPGLYEMVIQKGPSKEWMNDYTVSFEERTMKDINDLDDSQNDEKPFKIVAMVSEKNDKLYQTYVGQWIKLLSNEWTAAFLKQLHPLRLERYMISDLNPLLIPVKLISPQIRENRIKTDEDNPFVKMEKNFSQMMTNAWNYYRDVRDHAQETVFQNLYDNSLSEQFFRFFSETLPVSDTPETIKQKKAENKADKQFWLDAIEKGGYSEGVIRIIVATMTSDKIIEEAEMLRAEKIVLSNKRLYHIKRADLKVMVKEQARILQTNQEKALEALPLLLTKKSDRKKAIEIAKEMVGTEEKITAKEQALITKIETILS